MVFLGVAWDSRDSHLPRRSYGSTIKSLCHLNTLGQARTMYEFSRAAWTFRCCRRGHPT